MVRKILSFLVILTFIGGSFPLELEAAEQSFQELRNEVKTTSLGKKILPQVDRLLPKLSMEQLDEIGYKIDELYWQEDISAEQELIFDYLIGAIENERDARSVVTLTSTLSVSEQTEGEASLLQVQKTLVEDISALIKDMSLNWSELTHYEEKGNLAMKLDVDLGAMGSVKSGLDIKNYSSKQALFDQQLTAEVSAFIDATFSGEDIKAQGKSLLDFISKDGNIYFLAEKLELSASGASQDFEYQDIVQQLQELAKTKTYLKFADESSQAGLEILAGLTPANIEAELQKSASIPLFTPTGKEGNSYVLSPTKHFCDISKQALDIFDPFSGDTCSNGQYQNMLDTMKEEGITLLYTPGSQKALRLQIDNESASGEIGLIWSDTGISSLTAHIVDPTNPKQNKVSFAFFPEKSLEFLLQAEGDTVQASLSLTKTGTIGAGNLKATGKDIGSISLDYKNSALSFSLVSQQESGSVLCTGSGTLKEKFVDITMNCDIENPALSFIFPGQESMKIDMKLTSDMLAGKNNFGFSLTGTTEAKKIFSLEIQNTGTRISNPNIQITAPIKTIDAEEILDDVENTGF